MSIIVGKFFSDFISEETLLVEETKESGDLYLKGPFAQANIINNNRRLYPSEILDKAMEEFVQNCVNKQLAISELGHPETPRINQHQICCLITDLKKDGNNWMGKAKVLKTPCGEILKGLIKGGVRNGVSTRGIGVADKSTYQNEEVNKVREFKCVAVDVVHQPSGPDCYVESITESKEWILDSSNQKVYELNEETYRMFESQLKSLPKKSDPRKQIIFEAIQNFLNSLRANR